ncbi:hypothetical protein PIB30_019248 [Stylosanthes scabra]|uniref:Zinc finger GRF-type domain-containing protein n=1 Tax=Stylosanthes scabra TaxID=79078 RepID=A0ABU6R8H5_9FABA|nr:hypothetical protein [Stylosanthes scabra]
MQLNNSQGSGCSSRSRSQSSWVKTPSSGRVTKVPQWCGRGLRPVLRWSGTELNPDRPFYGCANYNSSGQRWCGLFVWADREEDDSMARRHQFEAKIDQGKKNLGFRVSKLEDEIRILKCFGLGLSIVMLAMLCEIVWNSLGVRK